VVGLDNWFHPSTLIFVGRGWLFWLVNGNQVFAASEVLELTKDRAWLVKVTNAVNQHWHKQNARKKIVLAIVH
jgi:hypothetical protein